MPVDPESDSTFVSLPRCWRRHADPPPRTIATGDRESHRSAKIAKIASRWSRTVSVSWDRSISDRQPPRAIDRNVALSIPSSLAPRFRKLIRDIQSRTFLFYRLKRTKGRCIRLDAKNRSRIAEGVPRLRKSFSIITTLTIIIPPIVIFKITNLENLIAYSSINQIGWILFIINYYFP